MELAPLGAMEWRRTSRRSLYRVPTTSPAVFWGQIVKCASLLVLLAGNQTFQIKDTLLYLRLAYMCKFFIRFHLLFLHR